LTVTTVFSGAILHSLTGLTTGRGCVFEVDNKRYTEGN
jgi:hypothetical protein